MKHDEGIIRSLSVDGASKTRYRLVDLLRCPRRSDSGRFIRSKWIPDFKGSLVATDPDARCLDCPAKNLESDARRQSVCGTLLFAPGDVYDP